MSAPPLPICPRKVKPHQLGWLRRPELEGGGQQIWEKPNGELVAHNPRFGPLMLITTKPLKPKVENHGRS